jgi:hypothetical protein
VRTDAPSAADDRVVGVKVGELNIVY